MKEVVVKDILVESARIFQKTGAKKKNKQLPGGKSRPSENIYRTAKRVSDCMLGIAEGWIVWGAHTVIEEAKDSPSYPALKTIYRKHIISAKLLDMKKEKVKSQSKPIMYP